MVIDKREVWVIMTKCGRYIAKGTPRNRELIEVTDNLDKKRFLTYSSKAKAEAGFKNSGFYTYGLKDFPYDYSMDRSEYLRAVQCEMTLKIT
jgi:hypothetical protein